MKKEQRNRLWAAIHEAGHAVAALAQGLDVRLVYVHKVGSADLGANGYCGAVDYGFDEQPAGWDGDRLYILTALAGPAANRLHKKRRLPRAYAIMFGGMNDIAKAKGLLCRYPFGDPRQLEKEFFREAEQLLEGHWSAVERIAGRLMVVDVVDRDELTALFRLA